MLFMSLWQYLALEPRPSSTKGSGLLIKHSTFCHWRTEMDCIHLVYVSVSISLGENQNQKNLCWKPSTLLFLRSPYGLMLF